MLPIKDILKVQVKEPCPPIMVIDECTIKTTTDAGPFCECHEKFEVVKKYKPFLPGMYNPYMKRKPLLPEIEDLKIIWVPRKINERGQEFERAVAVEKHEIPKDYVMPKHIIDDDMWLHLPRYSKDYYCEKLEQCREGNNEN